MDVSENQGRNNLENANSLIHTWITTKSKGTFSSCLVASAACNTLHQISQVYWTCKPVW